MTHEESKYYQLNEEHLVMEQSKIIFILRIELKSQIRFIKTELMSVSEFVNKSCKLLL